MEKPSLVTRMATGGQEESSDAGTSVPQVKPAAASRPKPVPKARAAAPMPKKKAAAVRKTPADARQKKMAVLALGLAGVFAAVVVLSFGGLGQAGAPKTDDTPTAERPAPSKAAVEWKLPAALPEAFRDPMHVADRNYLSSLNSDRQKDQFLLSGIVVGLNHPAAIVNHQIVVEGDVIDGAEIVRIAKNEVEFNRSGRHWVQTVQDKEVE